jgi:antitoxin component HigA of HigAB toxin-antitoxin module
VPYTGLDARQRLLDTLGQATDELARALASLSAAHEMLDTQQADRLEAELFRPLRQAYGRAKRAHVEFAARYGLPGREFAMPSPGAPSTGIKGFVEDLVERIGRAETELVGLQDSLMPIEVGDADLRAALSEVRRLLDGLSERARALLSTFGR